MKRRFVSGVAMIAAFAATALTSAPANAVTEASRRVVVAETDTHLPGTAIAVAAPGRATAPALHASMTGPVTRTVMTRPTVASQLIVVAKTYTRTYYYSRSDVEDMWHVLTAVGWTCHFLPLSYIASLGCGAPQDLADAITQAHYQKKRIKAVFHDCGHDYCNYYKYSVVK